MRYIINLAFLFVVGVASLASLSNHALADDMPLLGVGAAHAGGAVWLQFGQ